MLSTSLPIDSEIIFQSSQVTVRSSATSLSITLGQELGGFNTTLHNAQSHDTDQLKAIIKDDQAQCERLPQDLFELCVAIDVLKILAHAGKNGRGELEKTPNMLTTLASILDEKLEKLGPEALVAMIQVSSDPSGMVEIHPPMRPILCAIFLRFQEHYESPQFRDKIFTRAEFADWYQHGEGGSPLKEFSYYFDWSGFNFPDRILTPFVKGEFGKLSVGEEAILRIVRSLSTQDKFYLIGTSGDPDAYNNRMTRDHERRHALYYCDPFYKQEVDALLDTVDLAPMYTFLESTGGYHPSVWRDEAQAFLGGDLELLKMRAPDLDVDPYRTLSREIQQLMDRRLRFHTDPPIEESFSG